MHLDLAGFHQLPCVVCSCPVEEIHRTQVRIHCSSIHRSSFILCSGPASWTVLLWWFIYSLLIIQSHSVVLTFDTKLCLSLEPPITITKLLDDVHTIEGEKVEFEVEVSEEGANVKW